MRKDNANRNRIAAVRFTAAEFTAIEKRFKTTTCRQMSQYLRACLLNKPITTLYRNASLDECMLEIIRLRKELSALGNNFNQAVKKLHTLRQLPEFRDWISSTETQREELLEKIHTIQELMEKTAEIWLQ
ncbi:plasmid mobilization protein [Flavobacterium johnsoniae]|uniref:plasmid mobilization protein n=1 Tax=Flavobacterium johnsoniae TaxID=986 RepID=UPI003D999512